MAAKKKTAKATKTVAKTGSTNTATVKASVKQPTEKKALAEKSATKKKVTKKVTIAKTSIDNATEEPVKKETTSKKKVTTRKSASGKPPIAGTIPGAATGQFKTFMPYKPAKGEEYMNDGQMEHFRAILLDWKVSLMQEVDRTVGHMKSDATNFPDPNDRATQEEEFSLELRTRDRERRLIKKIDESITKLDEDEYGYCDGCGVEIGIRRLEARPTANMCIECKTLEEIREKQIA